MPGSASSSCFPPATSREDLGVFTRGWKGCGNKMSIHTKLQGASNAGAAEPTARQQSSGRAGNQKGPRDHVASSPRL